MGLKFADFHKQRIKDILYRFNYSVGGDITLNSKTNILNSYGGITDSSTASSTIKGYLKVITSQDKQLIEQGLAQIGEALFYTTTDYTITTFQDTLTLNNEEWEIQDIVEAPNVQGVVVHYVYRCKKR